MLCVAWISDYILIWTNLRGNWQLRGQERLLCVMKRFCVGPFFQTFQFQRTKSKWKFARTNIMVQLSKKLLLCNHLFHFETDIPNFKQDLLIKILWPSIGKIQCVGAKSSGNLGEDLTRNECLFIRARFKWLKNLMCTTQLQKYHTVLENTHNSLNIIISTPPGDIPSCLLYTSDAADE